MGTQNKSEFIVFICIAIFSMWARIEIVNDLPLGTGTTEYGLQGFDDEPSHYKYLRYVLEKGRLPVEQHTIADSNAFELNEFEYHQPPMYYLLIAGYCRISNVINVREQFYDGRYINLLISLLSFFIFYLIFFEIGWENKQIFAALSFVLLLGSHVYQTALFGNDVLSWFIFWLIFYLILTGSIKNGPAIAVLLTLGHYTKTNILLIYPVLIWSLYKEYKKASDKALLKSLIILIVPVVLALPWYIRNYQLYDSFLMLSGSEWQFTSGYFESIKKIIHAPYSFLFRMHFLPPKELISGFNIMQYLFVFPLIAAGLWQSFKNLKNDYNQQIFLILLTTVLAAYLWLALPTGFTEGRLLFPALPAIIYFIFIPLFRIEKKYKLRWFFKYVIMICIFVPPYIIGFYF